MPDLAFPELNADLGTQTADGLRNVANTAANFACTLYQNSPAAAVGYDLTGAGAFLNGLYSRLCAPRNKLPPPPQQQFIGGQCPKRYTVVATVIGGSGSGPFPPDQRTFTNVLGPITGFRFVPTFNNPDLITVDFVAADGIYSFGLQGQQGFVPTATVNSITPNSGSDDCGSQGPQFPPTLPPIVEVQNNLNVNFGGVTLNVPVKFQPIVIVAPLIFRPTISVDVGPINVQIGPDGVNFFPTLPGPTTPTSPTIDPRPLPPAPTPPKEVQTCPPVNLEPVLDAIEEVAEDVDDAIDRIKKVRVCQECDEDFNFSYVLLGTANNAVFDLPANTVRVDTIIRSKPLNIRTQGGGENAAQVVFAGFATFGYAFDQWSDREPLDYDRKSFIPEQKSPTKFMFTSYAGVEVEVLALRKVRKP